ncbi:RecX family transcriptional regulator [Paenibacillus sp. LHD-117]|uniref:RecX family transcriptional regulator n=1 Tax=Paenibacillus sp. LHD-117 TaxID=3071412 RepID=UPI0027E03706|nr:RecX family transcriptional regulator [Paenibacillus sp. LHD-117]MDQ6419182.1 RecX family transcriptional regulator [Paenibacillus sp. LHD-117]
MDVGDVEVYRIDAVRRDKKEKRRYHLHAGSEEPFLSVHEDILIRYRLMKDGEVTRDMARHIQDEDHRYRAYVLAVAYLGAKPRTSKQIHQYLTRKELEDSHIDYAIERLESEKLVDDEQYARQFAEGRLRTGHKGRLMIRQELQQRGVSKQAASEALSALDRDSELAFATALAQKKAKSLTGEPAKRRSKLMGFLLRRGFPGDIVREAMRSVDLSSGDGWEEEDDGVLLDN